MVDSFIDIIDYVTGIGNVHAWQPHHTVLGNRKQLMSVLLVINSELENRYCLDPEIQRFRHPSVGLGKHNESIEKLATLWFKLFGKAHKHRKNCVFIRNAYQPHPLLAAAGHVLSDHAHNYVNNNFDFGLHGDIN
jgi:hypothetical protein